MLLVLMVGYFLGQHFPAKNRLHENSPIRSSIRSDNLENTKQLQVPGSFQELESVPFRKTSHMDDQGRPITKQQLIDPFVLPRLAGISVATLLPGQRVSMHEHESMHEFFFILDGRGTFRVEKPGSDPQVVQVYREMFVHCAPQEKHEIVGPIGPNDDSLRMLVVGITLD